MCQGSGEICFFVVNWYVRKMFPHCICISRDNQLETSLKQGQLKLPITK